MNRERAQNVGSAIGLDSAQQSSGRKESRARAGAPFRSNDPQHEPAGESVRQCKLCRRALSTSVPQNASWTS